MDRSGKAIGSRESVGETESLGTYLKREREQKKISLRDLAKNTRVREHLLKAIEEDRYDHLPSPTFVKGFLTAYAKHVGLNPKDILARYDLATQGATEPHPEASAKEASSQEPPSRLFPTIIISMGIILAGLVVWYFFFYSPSKISMEPTPAKPVAEETASPPPPSPLAPQIAATLPSQPGKPISLRMKAIETTWVRLKADEQSEREMLLQPGETISQEAANQIYLLVGNAGGLDVTYNGKPLERYGKSGDVVTLIFTAQGVEVKRPEREPSPSAPAEDKGTGKF